MNKMMNVLAKKSPTILTGLGVVGVISTVVLAVKATPKALSMAKQATDGELLGYELPTKDLIKLTWKCYVPTAIMGGITIGCIIGANHLNLKRHAAVVGLYSLSETVLKEYQSKVIETIGKNKEKKIKDEIAHDRLVKNPITDREVILTGRGETLCYDALSGRYFKSDIEHIRQSLNKLSRDMMSDHFVTLNEVYDLLDLKSTKMGDIVGWHIDDGLIEPEFSTHLADNGIPCLVLDYMTEPRYNHNTY